VEREVVYIDPETYRAIVTFVEKPLPELSENQPLYIIYFRRIQGGLVYAVYHNFDDRLVVEVSYNGVRECNVRHYLTATVVSGGRKRRVLSAVYDEGRRRYYVVVEGGERVLMLPPDDDISIAMSEYSEKVPVRKITSTICAAASTTPFCRAAGPLKL
jgi:hypothetical protein